MNTRPRIWWWPWIGFLLALGLHLWHIGQPAQLVSDEVFFVNDGQQYVTGQPYFDPHPPLGKLQLGLVFSTFGFSPVTWRVLNAVAGALLVPLLMWIVWRLTKQRAAANIAGLLVLLDGLLLVDSRLGMINVPFILYGFTALATLLRALESEHPRRWLAAGGLAIGLSLSVKWLAGMIIVPAIGLWFWPQLFKQTRRATFTPGLRWWSVGAVLALPMLVYWLMTIWHFAWLHLPNTFWSLQQQMLNYHLSVPASGDPYANPWWGWLLGWRPFVYWSQATAESIRSIWSMANPWLWWTGGLAVLFNLVTGWRRSETRLLNILLLMSWLPFALIRRVMYSYHAMVFDLVMLMLLAVLLGRWWPKARRWVIGYLVVAVLVFLWFAPWYLNLPLRSGEFRLRQWLPTWTIAPTVVAPPRAAP